MSKMLVGGAKLTAEWAETIADLCGRELIIASRTKRGDQ